MMQSSAYSYVSLPHLIDNSANFRLDWGPYCVPGWVIKADKCPNYIAHIFREIPPLRKSMQNGASHVQDPGRSLTLEQVLVVWASQNRRQS